MAQKEEPMSPPLVSQLADTAKATARASLSPLRQRNLARASVFSEALDASRLRRNSSLSSAFSDTIDDARNSFRSTADDILLPKARSPEVSSGHEPSHWHSIPLALALLPAAGGLMFEKGSTVITDITLLALAAIFLNWSVRLPWDWYRSAQAINIQDSFISLDDDDDDTIMEEDENDGSQADRAASPAPSSPPTSPHPQPRKSGTKHSYAAAELRLHELLALLTCFISPIIGAWLLHHIRAQLSRPSEGLVSNYNLTIFLLASELRPLSHLIKLVQARTLYLQRSVTSNSQSKSTSSGPSGVTSVALEDITNRLNDLEGHIADVIPPSTDTPSKLFQSQIPDLTAQVRRSLQPDLEALNRAVRRYEKRATILSMQTDKRLQDLESRLSDAITLAAAAERSSQSLKQRRGSSSTVGAMLLVVVDWIAAAVLWPVQLLWTLISLPAHLASGVVGFMEDLVQGVRPSHGSSSARARGDAGRSSSHSSARGGGGGKGEISTTNSSGVKKRPSHLMGASVGRAGGKKSS